MVEQEGFRLYKRFIPQICGEKWIYRTKTSTIVCVGEGTVDFKVVEGETCFSRVGYLDWPENESIHGNYCALLDENFQIQSDSIRLGFERMYTGFHPQQIQEHSCLACQEAKTVAVCLLLSKSKICSHYNSSTKSPPISQISECWLCATILVLWTFAWTCSIGLKSYLCGCLLLTCRNSILCRLVLDAPTQSMSGP